MAGARGDRAALISGLGINRRGMRTHYSCTLAGEHVHVCTLTWKTLGSGSRVQGSGIGFRVWGLGFGHAYLDDVLEDALLGVFDLCPRRVALVCSTTPAPVAARKRQDPQMQSTHALPAPPPTGSGTPGTIAAAAPLRGRDLTHKAGLPQPVPLRRPI